MAPTNQAAGMLFGTATPTFAPEGESLIAHADRIDAMARTLIDEVSKFRTRLLDVENKVIPIVGTVKEKKAHPIKVCLSYFDECHKKKFIDDKGEPIPAKIDGSKDAPIMKRLIETYGEDKVRGLIDQFFADDDPWVRRAGYTVGIFSSRVAGLISSSKTVARGVTPRTAQNGRYAEEAVDMIQHTYGNGR